MLSTLCVVWTQIVGRKSLYVASGNFSKAECSMGIHNLSSKTFAVVQYGGCFSALTITPTHVQTESFHHNANTTIFAPWLFFADIFHILVSFNDLFPLYWQRLEYIWHIGLFSGPSIHPPGQYTHHIQENRADMLATVLPWLVAKQSDIFMFFFFIIKRIHPICHYFW